MNASIRRLIFPARTKQVRLLFRSALVLLSLAVPHLVVAQPGTLVKFTFESSRPTASRAGGLWITNVPAESGTGTASAWHQGACIYTSPAGNRSDHSFSATNWTVGDFWQFACSTIGVSNLSVSFDQVASGTGPANFQLQYSTDGSTFFSYGPPYTVQRSGGLTDVSPPYWSGLVLHTNTHYFVDLSSVAALNNQPTIWFRLTDTSPTSTGGGAVGSYGMARVDNFEVGGSGLGCVTWPNPGPTHYGFPLDTHQLNATACMPGTFIYSPPEGTVLHAGQYTLTAVFTPSNNLIAPSTNFVPLSVLRAALTVSAYNSARTVGATNPAFTGSIYGLVNGDNITASYSCFADSGSPAGDYTITPSLIDPNSVLTNYIVVTNTGTLTVSTGPIEEIILAQWNFNTNQAAVTVAGGQWYTNGPAVLGSGTASALHQRPTSYFGLPIDAANFALASTNWNVGDFWQFDFPINGATNLSIEVRRASSAPGPKHHNLMIGHGPIISTVNLEDAFGYCPPGAITNGIDVSLIYSSIPTSISIPIVINTHGLPALVGATNLTVVLQDASTTNANGGIVGPEGVDALYSVTVYGAVPLPPGTPVISWSTPPPITYGTPLSSSQLNATASTYGTFTYNPDMGAVLPVGTNVLSVVFTPSQSGYQTVSNTVNLVVNYASNPTLIHPIVLGPGVFQFTVSNIGPSTNYTVLFTSNLAAPVTNWTVIGSASLISPGLYQFTDSNATAGKGFYTVRSP